MLIHTDGDAAAHPDLAPLTSRSWQNRTHREALAELVQSGWTPCGLGDWAIALRSPSGRFAARVCPFDPAYAAFLELCRRCPGNRYLPRVELAAALDGGGTLTVLEFLAPAPAELATRAAERWHADGSDEDPEFEALRHAARGVDEEYRTATPWWYGIDLNAGNVRRALDSRLTLVDVFCMDGAALYGQVLKDADVVRRQIGEDRVRHLLEIPYIARESSPEEIDELRRAWGTHA
ncbi:hypothetical protein ACQUSR_05025 [Streptomyces sp. P1-3]|uniref:hypothetical protein n=1 Tax=Streptomyces sp. P1-3 TaxID=3421658 RepID=UPI003D35BDDF